MGRPLRMLSEIFFNPADTKFEVPFGIRFGKFGGAVSEIIIILPG